MDEDDLSKRLKILSIQEYKQYYLLPCFIQEEKEEVFNFSELENDYINSLKSIDSKILAMLQLGYFKSKKRFFQLDTSNPSVVSDIIFLSNKFFLHKLNIKSINFAKNTQSRQKQQILNLLSWSDKFETINIENKIKTFISIDSNPKYLFKELAKYLISQRIILPSYKDMQIIISKAFIEEEDRIFSKLSKLINPTIENAIEILLNKTEQETNYLLSQVRVPAKGFNYTQIYEEIKKLKIITPLFEISKNILNTLDLSISTINYFSEIMRNYNISKLKKLNKSRRFLLILCFVYQKYLKITDNLVKTYLHLMGKYSDEVKTLVKKRNDVEKIENSKQIAQLLNLYIDKNIDASLSFSEIREKVAYNILSKEQIEKIVESIKSKGSEGIEFTWAEYDKKYQTIKKNIRTIFENLDFRQYSNDKFFESVSFLQKQFSEKNKDFSEAPVEFIKKNQRKFIFEHNDIISKKEVNFKRYETLIYSTLKYKINTGDIFLENSSEYKHLENDLIDSEYFNKNSVQILESLNLAHLNMFEIMIENKLQELETLIICTNENIINGLNPHFKIKQKGKEIHWSLEYEKVSNDEFYEKLFFNMPKIDLIPLLRFVDEKTGFLSEFFSIFNKFSKSAPDKNLLLAVIIGYGTNFGLIDMASSSGLESQKLKNIKNSFIREETLNLAIEKINNEVTKLSIFEHFNIFEGIIHSSSDGQKYPTSGKIFNSRYSPKYFGLGKGLTALTLTANYQPLRTKIISPNEYEGYHNLELLLMNQSDIQPKIHSTDSHGLTDIAFALYDSCGFEFSPRMTNLNNRAESIYSPRNPSNYSNKYFIKPSKIVNKQLILNEAQNIRRVAASLVEKTSTVGNIVKKLCNMKNRDKTKKALSEYDKILRSIHILKTINDTKYRQATEISLNRGEALQQLKRAVGYANFGKIRVKDEIEQLNYQLCNQIICNAVAFYNSYLLSLFFDEKLEQQDYEQIDMLKRVSPISWHHINLYGKYDFDKNNSKFDQSLADNFLKGKKLEYKKRQGLDVDET